VRAEAGRAVVLAAGADRGRVEGVDRAGVGRGEGDVDAGRRLALAEPEERLAVAAEAADAALELHHQVDPERRQRRHVEVLAAQVVAHLEAQMVDHAVSFRSWKTASMLLPSGSSTKAP
jgi:hypothetical protein